MFATAALPQLKGFYKEVAELLRANKQARHCAWLWNPLAARMLLQLCPPAPALAPIPGPPWGISSPCRATRASAWRL